MVNGLYLHRAFLARFLYNSRTHSHTNGTAAMQDTAHSIGSNSVWSVLPEDTRSGILTANRSVSGPPAALPSGP